MRDKKGIHNSYNSPDSINTIDWRNKTIHHDVFDYAMYSTLKKCELEEGSSIIKVFPGVEFWGENGGTEIK